MTRLTNVCFDWGSENAEADRKIFYNGSWTFNTSPVHGHSTYSISGGTGPDLRLGVGPYDGTEWNHVANRDYYSRWMLYFTADPAGQARIGYAAKSGTGGYIEFRAGDGTNGSYVLWYNGTDTQTYYTSTQTWPQNEWVRVELRVFIGSGSGQCQLEVKANGTTILDQSGITRQTSWSCDCLYVNYLGPNSYLGSIVENDDQGSFQNSWPGVGGVVLLRPKADSQLGSWTGGGGGTSTIYEGVNNVPPVGTTTPTDANMIRSVDPSGDNSTDEYRVTLQSPWDVGVTSGENLVLIQSTVLHGEESATGTKTGSVGFVSGPAEGAFTSFTAGEDYGEAGTWPTNWSVRKGGVVNITGQSHTTTPVLGLRKTDVGSEAINVCGLGAYLEYLVGATPPEMLISKVQSSESVSVPVTFSTPVAGNQLFLSIARNDATAIATPDGWEPVENGFLSITGDRGLAFFHRTADGTEASAGHTGAYTHAFIEIENAAPDLLASVVGSGATDTVYDCGGDVTIPAGQEEVLLIGAEIVDTTSTGVTPDTDTLEISEQLNTGSTKPLHWVAYKVVSDPSGTEKVSGVGPNAAHKGHAYAYGKKGPIKVHFIGSFL